MPRAAPVTRLTLPDRSHFMKHPRRCGPDWQSGLLVLIANMQRDAPVGKAADIGDVDRETAAQEGTAGRRREGGERIIGGAGERDGSRKGDRSSRPRDAVRLLQD